MTAPSPPPVPTPMPPYLPGSPPPPTLARRRFTAWQVASMAGGFVGSVALCCIGVAVNYVLMDIPEDVEPGTTLELQTHPAGAVLYTLAVLALVGGFVGVWLLGRARARAEGRTPDTGRPPLSWRTVVSPRGMSRLLFVPRGVYGVDDELMGRLGLARSVLGIAITAVVAVAASRDTGQLAVLLNVLVAQAFNALIVGSIVLVAAGLVLLALVPGPQRSTARRALLRPATTLGYTWLIAALVAAYSEWVMPWLTGWIGDDGLQNIVEVLFAVAVVVHIGWLVAFIVFGMVYAARYAFNGGDGHPALPAVFSIVLAWTFIALSLITAVVGPVPGLVGEADLAIPTGLAAALSVGGALTVSALALVELVRLRRRGLRLPAGPWR